MDFIDHDTGEPVNSPFNFELCSVPNALSQYPSLRLRSLERAWGILPTNIAPGEEKFVLKDGMTCVLRRPGYRDIRFTVPLRISTPAPSVDVVDLDFPAVVR